MLVLHPVLCCQEYNCYFLTTEASFFLGGGVGDKSFHTLNGEGLKDGM